MEIKLEISSTEKINGEYLNTEELLSYLSQIVMVKKDEDLRKKSEQIKTIKSKIRNDKDKLNQLKIRLKHVHNENNRLSKLHDVLSNIQSLMREGLMGNNRLKVINLLDNIKDDDIKTLDRINLKLSQFNRQSFGMIST